MSKMKISIACASLLLGACSSDGSVFYLADVDLKLQKQCTELISHREASLSGSFDSGKKIYIFGNGVACVHAEDGSLDQTFQYGLDGNAMRATHRYITQNCYGLFNCQRLEKIGEQEPMISAGTMVVMRP